MKKYLFSAIVLISGFCYSQKRPWFSIDLKANAAFPMGNNFMADGLKPFTGFGMGLNALVYRNFGIGLELNKFYSNVKDTSVFGSLKTPALTDFSVFVLYRHSLNEKWNVEGQIGGGNLHLKSRSDYRSDGFSENANSFILGGKALYNLSDDKMIQVFVSPKVYFYSSDIKIDDNAAEKYYSKATLLNINAGVRFNF